jgi:hypothetical protein
MSKKTPTIGAFGCKCRLGYIYYGNKYFLINMTAVIKNVNPVMQMYAQWVRV